MKLTTALIRSIATALLVVSASAASAVTVTVTQSGLLTDVYAGLNGTSSLAATGDFVSQTTVVDLDQTAQTGIGSIVTGGTWSSLGDFTRVESALFQADSAQVALPAASYSEELTGVEVQLTKLQLANSTSAGFNSEFALLLEVASLDQAGQAVFSLAIWESDLDVFSLNVEEILASSNINFLTSVLGLSMNDFSGTLIDGAIDFAYDAGANSPVAAVPLPAPFLMLGMALAGLFSLGRRSRA